MDEQEMEHTQERIFEGPYCRRHKEQENSVYGSNRRAHIHDSKMLPKLVEDILRTNGCSMIDKIIADGAYDSNDIFRCLSEKGIVPCIKVRKNSRVRKTGHLFRNLSVIAQRNNYEQWKDSVSYGQRWIVETVFSSLKRMFGEYVYSVKLKNMKQELMLKASLYNKFLSL